MKLPAETFDKITGSISIESRDTARPSDRRSPRVRLSHQLSVARWDHPAETMAARVRDISIGGAGLLHHERIALDERLVIRFPLQAGQSVLVAGIVVYWEPLAEGLFTIGVQFERTVDESEWAAHTLTPAGTTGVIGRITGAIQRRMSKAS